MLQNQDTIDASDIVVVEDISERKIIIESIPSSTDEYSDDADDEIKTESDKVSEKAPSEKAPSEKAPSERAPSVKPPSERALSVKPPSERAPSEIAVSEREFTVRSRASVMEEEGKVGQPLPPISPKPPSSAVSKAPSVTVETPQGEVTMLIETPRTPTPPQDVVQPVVMEREWRVESKWCVLACFGLKLQ